MGVPTQRVVPALATPIPRTSFTYVALDGAVLSVDPSDLTTTEGVAWLADVALLSAYGMRWRIVT